MGVQANLKMSVVSSVNDIQEEDEEEDDATITESQITDTERNRPSLRSRTDSLFNHEQGRIIEDPEQKSNSSLSFR